MSELETLTYDLGLPLQVLGRARHLLTRAVDANLAGSGHPADYLAIGCFYLACKMCGSPVGLDRLLSTSLANRLKPAAMARSVRNLLRHLNLKVCPKCGKEAQVGERFCNSCGSWLSDSVISQFEMRNAESLRLSIRKSSRERPDH